MFNVKGAAVFFIGLFFKELFFLFIFVAFIGELTVSKGRKTVV